MSPLFSVLTPVYNGELYIEDTIKSVLKQSNQNFEYILVNDGSSDKSSEIINDYAIMDNRIVVLDRKYNIGPAKTMNQGISLARGKYVAQLSHDDKFSSTALEKFNNYFEENPHLSLLGSFMHIFHKEDRLKKFQVEHNMIKYIHHPFIGMGTLIGCFKKEIMERFSYRSGCIASDVYLLSEILLESKIGVGTIPEVLYYYRRHETNLTNNSFTMNECRILRMMYMSKLYNITVDPIIAHTLKNLNQLNKENLIKTNQAIMDVSDKLDRGCSPKVGVDLGKLWRSYYSFLLDAA